MSSLAGSVFATCYPIDSEDVQPCYGWDFPRPLPVQAVQLRYFDHAQLVQLLDDQLRVVASLVLPLPPVDGSVPMPPTSGDRSALPPTSEPPPGRSPEASGDVG